MLKKSLSGLWVVPREAQTPPNQVQKPMKRGSRPLNGGQKESLGDSRVGAYSPYASGWAVGRRSEQSWPLLPSSGALLARRWFFSGGWRCRRRSPAPLGAFLTRRWFLPWGDIFRTWRTRRHHLGFWRGSFFSGSSSKQPKSKRTDRE